MVNTTKKIVDIYNNDYRLYKEYNPIHWTEIETYGFDELKLINIDIVMDYFDNPRFFEDLEFIDNAKEVLHKLKDTYNIIICSLGKPQNLYYKKKWIEKHLPFADFVGVDCTLHSDKSCIDMAGSVFIDDCVSNLNTSNAKEKIIFGDVYEWNKENVNGYKRCFNWTEVEKYLLNKKHI